MTVFSSLRLANRARQAEWDTGGDITLSYSGNELAGEVGEFIESAVDALNHPDDDEMLSNLRQEIGDVIICCDLIGNMLDIPVITSVPQYLSDSDPVGAMVKDILLDVSICAGMICNTVKKRERERFGMVGARGSIDDIQRDINMLIDHIHLIADEFGISVSRCVADKFNLTSAKYGLKTQMVG